MALTTAQLQALKAHIAADPVLDAIPKTSDGAFDVAAALNQAANPDFWVWRTVVLKTELVNSTSQDGTTFSWSEYISRSQGERDAFTAMFNSILSVNAALPQVRQGLADIFSGPSGAANRTHLLAVARRKATRAEKLFATGTGSTASPATMVFEGTLTYSDVTRAWALP